MTTRSDGFPEAVTRVGWLSSWNSKCGIAEYSKFLLDAFDGAAFEWTLLASLNDELLDADQGRVLRCWTNRLGRFEPLQQALSDNLFDIVVVQFNFSFLSLEHLERLIACCRAIGTRLVVIFHSTKDVVLDDLPVSLRSIAPSLAAIDLILCHAEDDVSRLRGFGVEGNVELFPHGYVDIAPEDKQAARADAGLPSEVPVIGSYGFLLPHKGVDILIEAFALLRASGVRAKLLLANALYPSPVSSSMLARCRQIASDRGVAGDVIFETRFLPNDDSIRLLAACDVIVYPYQTTQESSSAAVRLGIASHRPVLCTPLPIFSDVAEVVGFLGGTDASDICRGLQAFLADQAAQGRSADRQDNWLHRFAWPRVAGLLQGIVEEMSDYKYSAFQAEIRRQQVTIDRQQQEIETGLKELESKAAEVAFKEMEIAQKQAEIEGIYASSSWRVTEPLRRMSGFLRFGLIGIARRLVHRFPTLRRLRPPQAQPVVTEVFISGVPLSGDPAFIRHALPPVVGETLDLLERALG